jgi:hypothetical protein
MGIMTVIPSPLSLVCFVRGLLWSLTLWKPVKGHRFVAMQPSDGQPKCVTVLQCKDCGVVSVGWETCSRCSTQSSGTE